MARDFKPISFSLDEIKTRRIKNNTGIIKLNIESISDLELTDIIKIKVYNKTEKILEVDIPVDETIKESKKYVYNFDSSTYTNTILDFEVAFQNNTQDLEINEAKQIKILKTDSQSDFITFEKAKQVIRDLLPHYSKTDLSQFKLLTVFDTENQGKEFVISYEDFMDYLLKENLIVKENLYDLKFVKEVLNLTELELNKLKPSFTPFKIDGLTKDYYLGNDILKFI